MGRLARVIAVDVPHHLTQRGNDRRYILECDVDRVTYLSWLRENVELYRVSLLGYCLMSNHVHLIAVPSTADTLSQALKQTHGRYASYWNTVHRASGHVWQGRYYSCPLDEPHLWEALRYTELNPLRARLVLKPESWPWSSAASHCGIKAADEWLSLKRWRDHWTAPSWREYLAAGELESQLAAIRLRTHTGRPWGSAEFIHGLETTTRRDLTPQKRGPREKIVIDRSQSELPFEP
jgi:putative transposase